MTDRHMHITSFLYDHEPVIERFIAAADSLGFFGKVIPVRWNDRIRAVAFYSKDLDGVSDELEMPQVAEKLSDILTYDVEIVSAWERGDRQRERERI
jgi:hypothetical protein